MLNIKQNEDNMNTQEKTYITANELSEKLGISVGQAYKALYGKEVVWVWSVKEK